MSIAADFRQLMAHAGTLGWQWGDPLGTFPFAELPPGQNGFREMFGSWLDEAERLWGTPDDYERVFSMGYVYAIQILQTGGTDDAELSTQWLAREGIPYPQNANQYPRLYHGLWSYFGHQVPYNTVNGRQMHRPLTGIGRQSGFYARDYAECLVHSILRRCEGGWEGVRDNHLRVTEIVEELAGMHPPLLSPSKIPRNGNQYDYQEVGRFCSALAKLFLDGQVSQDNADQMAEHLQVSRAIAESVARALAGDPGGVGAPTGARPIIRRRDDGSLEVVLPGQTDFGPEGIAAGTDVFFAVNQGGETIANWHFRAQGETWRTTATNAPACVLDPSKPIEVVRVHRDTVGGQRTIIRTDVTPVVLEQPLVLADERGRVLSGAINKLVPGNQYYGFATCHWSDGLVLHEIGDDGNRQAVQLGPVVVGARTSRLAVSDRYGAEIQEFHCRRNDAISFSFGDADLFPYAPGRRCFRRPPTIDWASVGGAERVRIADGNGVLFESGPNPGAALVFPLDLGDVWQHVPDTAYGPLDVTLWAGRRHGTRRFCLLPRDFDDNLGTRIPVQASATVTLSSDSLRGEHCEVALGPDQDKLDFVLEFDNEWRLAIRAPAPRRGAYLSFRDGTTRALLDDGQAVEADFDDLVDGATLVVADDPGRIASVLFCTRSPDGGGIREYIGDRIRADGRLSLPFGRVRREGSYRRLAECDLMTVQTRYRLADDPHRLGRLSLTHFRRKRPDKPSIDGDSVVFSHTVSDANMVPPPFLVLFPVGAQDSDQLPTVAPVGRSIPPWCKALRQAMLSVESNGQSRRFVLDDPGREVVGSAGHIGFVMGGDSERPRRLSNGFYLRGTAPEDELDEMTTAWRDRDLPRLDQFFHEGPFGDVEAVVKGIQRNAKRVDGYHFLNAVFAMDSSEPSGYVFRASQVWFGSMLREWTMWGQVDADTRDALSFMRRFWDDELFGYQEFATAFGQIGTANASGLLQAVMNHYRDGGSFCSWAALAWWRIASPRDRQMLQQSISFLRQELKEHADRLFDQDVEMIPWLLDLMRAYAGDNTLQYPDLLAHDWGNPYPNWANALGVQTLQALPDPRHPYLARLGYRLHIWRKAPQLSTESNRLRDEMLWLRQQLPPAASMAALWGFLFAANDPQEHVVAEGE